MWPRVCASVAMANAKASEIFSSRATFAPGTRGALSPTMAERQMKMNSSMPTNSAATALQKPQLFTSVISASNVSDVWNPTCKRFGIYSEGLCAEGGGKRKEEKRCAALKFGFERWLKDETSHFGRKYFIWNKLEYLFLLYGRYSASPRRGPLISFFHCWGAAEQRWCLFSEGLLSGCQQIIVQKSRNHTGTQRTWSVHLKNRKGYLRDQSICTNSIYIITMCTKWFSKGPCTLSGPKGWAGLMPHPV